MSKLEEILQAEVDAEVQEILSDAETRAAQIISEAESRSQVRVTEYRKMLDSRKRAAAQQASSASELTVSNAQTLAKGEVMDLLRQKVLAALEETSSRPNYSKVLESLAQMAVEVVESPVAIVVHPKNQDKLGDWAEQHGLELKTDPELRLGVRIISKNGTMVENTLLERLERAWGSLAPQVTRMLWE
jgi:V/A-type H+/Na+-transporting ATPase subunit E